MGPTLHSTFINPISGTDPIPKGADVWTGASYDSANGTTMRRAGRLVGYAKPYVNSLLSMLGGSYGKSHLHK